MNMRVEMRDINAIRPYPNNPRVNDAAIEAVARSIREYGWNVPIVCDEDLVILAGHTRWKAAKVLGLKEVPVYIARGLTEAQKRGFRIADNATSALSSWDDDKLIAELQKLQEANFDLSLTGFDESALLKYLAVEPVQGMTDPDDIPAPPDEALTQPGDLILLGSHRLLCGDSSKVEDVDRLLASQPVHLIHADPPYNVQIQSRSSTAIAAGLSSFSETTGTSTKEKKLRAKDRPLDNDNASPEEFARLLRLWFANMARVLEPGRSYYLWGGYSNIENYPAALRECGLHFSQTLIWIKEHPVIGRKDFMGNHEWCFYGWKEGRAHEFFGPNNAVDTWNVKKINPGQMLHLTQKPVELAARALEYSSRRGENVLDLFAGSGTTLIAAEQLGRVAYVMEIDPLYCDVIVSRWEAHTGKKAIRPAREVPVV
jgi:DNA modification methylase